jgi:hypothetical protein
MPVGPGTVYSESRPHAGGPGVGFDVSAGAELSLTRDGTPSRVAGILILSGAALAILRLSGFRFNVGVSS